RFGLRLGFTSEMSRYRLADALEDNATTDGTKLLYQPSLDVTFVTQGGLILFAGVQRLMLSPYDEKFDGESINATTPFNAATVDTPRVGAIRQAGGTAFGLYYGFGEESKRSFRK